jgi:hypothetical protein
MNDDGHSTMRNVRIHFVGHQQGKKQFGTAMCVFQDDIKTDNLIKNLN